MNEIAEKIYRVLRVAGLTLLMLAACREPQALVPTATQEAVPVDLEPTGETALVTSTATTAPTSTTETATATTAAPAPSVTATAEPDGAATPEHEHEQGSEEPSQEPSAEEGLLLSDDFTDSSSGWPPSREFGNYFVGYHEPEWYHVQVNAPNDLVPVVLEGQSFKDATFEADMFVEKSLSDISGDFRYGLVLRASGRQFYAFTIDPQNRTWAVLKSSPASVETIAEGGDDSIQGLEAMDQLRVDALGSTLTFVINGNTVVEVEDDSYAAGELGFFVQTFDAPRIHIHYDAVRVAMPQDPTILVSDDFRDASSGWRPSQQFGNYFVGYHEPEWYHVQIDTPNEHVAVTLEGQSFENASIESDMFVETSLSEDSGDFRYGLALRASGKQFYAFTIDPHNSTWAVLKSSPSSLETLAEGSDSTIQGLQGADTLRVDAFGANFQFHINGKMVVELEDDAYSSGETGFFVQTFDSERIHIHYDSFSVRQVEAPEPICTVIVRSLNLRPGPGVAYAPPLRVLTINMRLIPLARSDFPPWIQVQVEETGETGWVYAGEPYATCNFDISELPRP